MRHEKKSERFRRCKQRADFLRAISRGMGTHSRAAILKVAGEWDRMASEDRPTRPKWLEDPAQS